MRLIIAIVLIPAIVSISGCAATKMIANSGQLCQDWREMSVSKHDTLTQKTAAQIEASNETRKNWGCTA